MYQTEGNYGNDIDGANVNNRRHQGDDNASDDLLEDSDDESQALLRNNMAFNDLNMRPLTPPERPQRTDE